MTITLSPAFLQRISGYPENVQQRLTSMVDAKTIRAHLAVLHGSGALGDEKLADLLTKPVAEDGFLSRLMRSRKFRQRLMDLPDRFEVGSMAENRALIAEFVIPLGDPDKPYLYKLQEFLDNRALDPEMAGPLKLVMALINFLDRAAGYPHDPVHILINEFMAAGMPDGNPLLPCLVKSFGGPDGFRAANPLPDGLSMASGTGFVRAALADLGSLRLNDIDAATLSLIVRDMANATGEVALSPPQPLRISLTGPTSESTRKRWQDLRHLGLADKINAQSDPTNMATLSLPAELPISPLLLAYLHCIPPGDAHLSLRCARPDTRSSWADRIIGYADTSLAEEVGMFRCGQGDLPDTQSLEIVADIDTTTLTQPVSPENCYAILVNLGDHPDPGSYLNADRCVMLNGLDELARRFVDATAMTLQKPVVLLSRHSPAQSEYVIEMVQRFWAYGGRYAVTPMRVYYDSQSGQLRAISESDDTLTRIAMADLTTWPLSKLMDHTVEIPPHRLILAPDGMVVVAPKDNTPSYISPEAVNRMLGGIALSDFERDAAHLSGQVDREFLSSKSSITHWPVARILNRALAPGKRLETLVERFLDNPGLALANEVISALDAIENHASLTPVLNEFVQELSRHPQILLLMNPSATKTILRQARQAPAVDAVATNLALCAGDICCADFENIIPLFELLASGLPAHQLQAALGFAATTTKLPKRGQYRIAECIRRYGSDEVMQQYIVHLQRAGIDILDEPRFLRNFHRVLSSDALPALQAMIGARTISAICATQDFKDEFKRALVNRDGDTLARLLRDPAQTESVDFSNWLDGLRSQSNALFQMQLPVQDSGMTQLNAVNGRKLAAAVFANLQMLNDLDQSGLLNDGSDLSLVCKNILGQNDPLNAMLFRRFDGSGISPLVIEGQSAAEVFANAATAILGGQQKCGPKVSVIISAFNPDIELFSHSLASILNQSHNTIEIFVVDDASDPEIGRQIRHITEAHDAVRFIRMDQNSGPYLGRNCALASASGEFIAIQDADDWSHPDRFAQQVEAFTANPMLQLVTTPHIRIDRHGHIQMEARFTICGDGPMSSMFRRSAFDRAGGFAAVRSRGDVEMRERLRSYFGTHALKQLSLPMMLCFADANTLSQKTKSDNHEFLQLFRSNISGRPSLRHLYNAGVPLGPDQAIAVPVPLRPGQKV